MGYLMKNFNLSKEDAKEIFQASIIACYDNVMTGKLIEFKVSLKSYLYGIARNKSLSRKDYLKKHTDDSSLILFGVVERAVEPELNLARIGQLTQGLEEMGDPCKTLLQLFYYRKMSMIDIGEEMGYKNSDTVKNQKYKCIKRLQKIVLSHPKIKVQYDS